MTILLLILGAAIIFWLQDWVYRNHWQDGLSADIHFQSHAAIEGEYATVTETVVNRKILPIPALTVKFQFQRNIEFENMENASVSDRCYRSDVFSILFYQKIVRTLTIACKKRGYYTIENMDLVGSNLLMTKEYVTAREQFTELYVYPRPINVEELDLLFQRIMGEIVRQRYLYPDPFEFRGIREYQTYDPMNTINWNASARSEGLMVNTYHTTNSQEMIFLLDVEDETVWKYEALHEMGIRLVAALTERCLQQVIPICLYSNGRDLVSKEPVSLSGGIGVQQATSMYEALSRIDLGQQPFAFEELVQELLGLDKSNAMLVFISSSQNERTVEAFEKIAEHYPGACWIVPLHSDLERKVVTKPQYQVIFWEVPYE